MHLVARWKVSARLVFVISGLGGSVLGGCHEVLEAQRQRQRGNNEQQRSTCLLGASQRTKPSSLFYSTQCNAIKHTHTERGALLGCHLPRLLPPGTGWLAGWLTRRSRRHRPPPRPPRPPRQPPQPPQPPRPRRRHHRQPACRQPVALAVRASWWWSA